MEEGEGGGVGEEYLERFGGWIKEIVVKTTMYDGNGDDVSGEKLKEEEGEEKEE